MHEVHQSVLTIFTEALEFGSREERVAYLAQACRGNPELHARVESLLRAHEDAGRFLAGHSSNSGPASALASQSEEKPGTTIGPYKLLEQIGEGGFGIVFMAEQAEPIRRKVALKVLKPGMDTRQVVVRFEVERQALALMDHPHIARVLDAGSTESGRPYFAMELVRGVPVTEYCEREGLPLRARLGLFIDVCHAVQHAHQKGVIHRDLKPSNVMVTLHDGVPVVKVIDFGIAKAIREPLTERTFFTGFAQFVGTPMYMSPEQAELSGLDVDTRSDIYSLGVLLYELLTGTTPFDHERLRGATFDEIRRIIREEIPPRPSARVSTAGQSNTIASIPPGARPRGPALRGDLDWVVMRALEKDRNRRYPTANALAADAARYLAGEPVEARPPSAAYRLGKFAKRNKLALLSAAAVAGALITGTAVSVWQSVRAGRAETSASRLLAAEQKTRRERDAMLWRSYLNEARALRQTGLDGHRFDSLDALRKASEMLPAVGADGEKVLALRNEWIACSALPVDLRVAREVHASGTILTADPSLKNYYCLGAGDVIHVRRFADDREVARLTPPDGDHDIIWGRQVSADGRYLAVRYSALHGSPDSGVCRVWDLRNGRVVRDVRMAADCFALDFDRNGSVMVYGRDDRCVHRLDLATKEELPSLADGPAPPYRLSLSPDGLRLAVCYKGKSEVHIRNARTGEVVRTLNHPAPVLLGSWSSDGKLLALPCKDFNIYVWDADTGSRRCVLRGHRWGGVYAAFRPGGYHLWSSGWDGTRRVWDAATGLELIRTHSARPAVQFREDGGRLVTATQGGGVVWEVVTSRTLRRLPVAVPSGSERYGVAVHPGGRLLACGSDDGVHLWDLAADREAARLEIGPCYSVAFQPGDGTLIAAGDCGLHRWPLTQDEAAYRVGAPKSLGPAASRASLSPGGRFLATLAGSRVSWLDLETGRARVSPSGHSGAGFVAVSPDGRWVASGTLNQRDLKLWDTRGDPGTVRVLWEARGPHLPLFSPAGDRLLVSNNDECRVYETENWGVIHRFAPERRQDGGEPQFGPAAFTADSTLLALRPSISTVRLIDTATWREVATLEPFEPRSIAALAFGPDDSQLAAASINGVVQLWDLREVRTELSALGLDWGGPTYPPVSGEAGSADPLEVRVGMEATFAILTWAWERALRRNPDDPAACNALAWQYANTPGGDLEQALRLARKATKRFPREGKYLNTLGVVYYRLGRFREAAETLEKAVPLHPGREGLDFLFLAMSYHHLGERDQAMSYYDRAVRWLREDRSELGTYRLTLWERFRAEAESLLSGKAETPAEGRTEGRPE